MNYYSSHFTQLPYQWIRELGQDKRDYAYLPGYNIFGAGNFSADNSTAITTTPTPTTTYSTTISTGSGSATNGKGFFVKPGPGNAVDGYLIFAVMDNVAKKDLNATYVQIQFNGNSGTRWRLEQPAK